MRRASEFLQSFESTLRISDLEESFAHFIALLLILVFENEKLATIEANNFEELYDVGEKTWMVNRTLKNNVAKVTGTSLHILFTGETSAVLVHDTHSGIVNGVEVGLESLLVVDEGAGDLGNRHRAY